MSDKPLPKMSYAQQQSYNALKAIDAASQPYQEGEDLMTTIARINLEDKARAQGAVDAERLRQLRSVLVDFLNWYSYGDGKQCPNDAVNEVVDNYLRERLK